jgi:hypothetical protein
MPWASAAVVVPTMIAIVAMSVFKVMFLLRELGTDTMSMRLNSVTRLSWRRPE